jgi:hypothetical protein
VRGCPVIVSVVEGHPVDSLAFLPAVQRVRERFSLPQVVMVGDRSMMSQESIGELRGQGGIDWITALKRVSIRGLVEHGICRSAWSTNATAPSHLAGVAGKTPSAPRQRWTACTSSAPRWMPSAWTHPSARATTRPWPTWSVRSVR